jgi:hypothetical protein
VRIGISELYRRIALVTTRFEFTEPVEDEDLRAFSGALVESIAATSIGAAVKVERDPDPRYVLVEVESPDGGYRRQLIICRIADTCR